MQIFSPQDAYGGTTGPAFGPVFSHPSLPNSAPPFYPGQNQPLMADMNAQAHYLGFPPDQQFPGPAATAASPVPYDILGQAYGQQARDASMPPMQQFPDMSQQLQAFQMQQQLQALQQQQLQALQQLQQQIQQQSSPMMQSDMGGGPALQMLQQGLLGGLGSQPNVGDPGEAMRQAIAALGAGMMSLPMGLGGQSNQQQMPLGGLLGPSGMMPGMMLPGMLPPGLMHLHGLPSGLMPGLPGLGGLPQGMPPNGQHLHSNSSLMLNQPGQLYPLPGMGLLGMPMMGPTGSDTSAWMPGLGYPPNVDEKVQKRIKRKLCNRESARRSRLRRQAETEGVDADVKTLVDRNVALKGRLERLNLAAEGLKLHNSSLEEGLSLLQARKPLPSRLEEAAAAASEAAASLMASDLESEQEDSEGSAGESEEEEEGDEPVPKWIRLLQSKATEKSTVEGSATTKKQQQQIQLEDQLRTSPPAPSTAADGSFVAQPQRPSALVSRDQQKGQEQKKLQQMAAAVVAASGGFQGPSSGTLSHLLQSDRKAAASSGDLQLSGQMGSEGSSSGDEQHMPGDAAGSPEGLTPVTAEGMEEIRKLVAGVEAMTDAHNGNFVPSKNEGPFMCSGGMSGLLSPCDTPAESLTMDADQIVGEGGQTCTVQA